MNHDNPTQHAEYAWQQASQLTPPPKPPRLEFYMPAMPSLTLIHRLEMRWWHYRRRQLFRRHVVPLLAYDDHVLQDIGHCRENIHWANQLPLSVDAVQALEEKANIGVKT
ncbi:hypothetical protein [Vreelandella maris]|uniref:DUF1127 domain-containing protein n=1 Tax=Vreelandella maris TaxID=2729617 RepID=A0A7Y6VA72_9GAMM|nr:hypothetical protein [Halomonas maris]NVF15241.1 hypothetical protein [Halomonas maris]|tara:strand:+ start:337 stop:666 length:330 start_codon:yes stop_codon:yes gene_type:complete